MYGPFKSIYSKPESAQILNEQGRI